MPYIHKENGAAGTWMLLNTLNRLLTLLLVTEFPSFHQANTQASFLLSQLHELFFAYMTLRASKDFLRPIKTEPNGCLGGSVG